MMKYVRIADLTLKLEVPDSWVFPQNLLLFEIEEPEVQVVDHSYHLEVIADERWMETLSQAQARWMDGERMERTNLLVFARDNLECRWIYFEGAPYPYAICEELSPSDTRVLLHQDELPLFCYETIFTSVLSMERYLLQKDSMILHCAYMCRDGEAILFSAPSGTGKSTQAELWEKYRGTRQINGDASILNQRDGQWMAHGFQVCGSSQICHNESYPIRAIVMLYQAPENTCRRLQPFDAFMKIYAQVKVNMWSMDFQNHVLELLDDLVAKVPVLELGCTISEDAVFCLEQQLCDL